MKEIIIYTTVYMFKMSKNIITKQKNIVDGVSEETCTAAFSELPKTLYQNISYEYIFFDYYGTYICFDRKKVGAEKEFTSKEVAKLVGYKIN